MSDEIKRVAVIGAGIFGCGAALAIANAGFKVTLLERLPDIIMGTSKNNTNRVHQGFHYPRDIQTAKECRNNYLRFENEFSEALLDDYPNIYCIAQNDSLTSKKDFLKFCDTLELSYSVIDLKRFGIQIEGCNLGISCRETILDSDILRNILKLKIKDNKNVNLVCSTEVVAIKKSTHQYDLQLQPEAQSTKFFDAVVNCSYANINTLTEQLGHGVCDSQYEYTVVPIVDLNMPPTAITIMDGPFMTIFPYGKSKHFLLYHVEYSVIETEINKKLSRNWLDPHNSPLRKIDATKHFEKFLKSCSEFVPAFSKAKLCGFLEAPRMVLPKHEQDDARPSFVTDYGEGYFTVFSGKIDRSLSIADSVCLKLKAYFERNKS